MRSEYLLGCFLNTKFSLVIIMHMIFEEENHVSSFQFFILSHERKEKYTGFPNLVVLVGWLYQKRFISRFSFSSKEGDRNDEVVPSGLSNCPVISIMNVSNLFFQLKLFGMPYILMSFILCIADCRSTYVNK